MGKTILTAFWNWQEIFWHKYLPEGSTVNVESYLDTLMKLQMAIERKSLG